MEIPAVKDIKSFDSNVKPVPKSKNTPDSRPFEFGVAIVKVKESAFVESSTVNVGAVSITGLSVVVFQLVMVADDAAPAVKTIAAAIAAAA